MALVIKQNIEYPVKIGVEDRVAIYAATLLQGEEQLLVTRTGKFFLTDGHGSFTPFSINDIGDYVKTVDYDAFKLSIQNSISTLDGAILDVIDDLGDTTTLATHSNRDVLDKFSEDADGNPLYDGNKLATSVEITDAEMDTDINTIWGDTI